MRDRERIPPFIEALLKAWLLSPTLGFGELLERIAYHDLYCCLPDINGHLGNPEVFSTEDAAPLHNLNKFIEQGESISTNRGIECTLNENEKRKFLQDIQDIWLRKIDLRFGQFCHVFLFGSEHKWPERSPLFPLGDSIVMKHLEKVKSQI